MIVKLGTHPVHQSKSKKEGSSESYAVAEVQDTLYTAPTPMGAHIGRGRDQ
jgi:hypothetical protein